MFLRAGGFKVSLTEWLGLMEGMEKGLDHIAALSADHFHNGVVQRGAGRADGENGKTAKYPQNAAHHDLADTTQQGRQ